MSDEKMIHTVLGNIRCNYGPPARTKACTGHGSWPDRKCKNRARYEINGQWLCLRHAQHWAFKTLIGEENIADPVYGRVGGDS